jgi:DNA-binding beta-propeller fold protein YncE
MKTQMRTGKRLTGAMLIIALTLLSAVVASAQTSTTTTKQVASTDTTAVTSVGLDAGVTSMAGDSNGNVYASLQFSNKVVKLNGGGTVIGTFTVGRNPTGLIVDNTNGLLYVLNNADNTVSKLKLDGTPVATFKVAGDGPVHAALYAGVLYVACERSNTLVRLAAADGTAIGSSPVGARPVWVVVGITTTRYKTSSSGGDLMLADSAASSDATVSDPSTGTQDGEPTTVDASTTDGTDPYATSTASDSMVMSADGSGTSYKTVSTVSIYVSCNKDNQVWKLSNDGTLAAKFATGRGPFGLALNSKGEVLVACFWDAVVMRFSSAGALLSKTAVGDGPAGMIPYGGSYVAVISNGANTITRLSVADGMFISKDLVDRSPLIGTATPSALWVACTGSGTIAKRAL